MNKGRQKIFCLIAMMALLNSSINASVIIGDAEFLQVGDDPPMLITPHSGPLGIFVTDEDGGAYNFSFGLIANEYGFYSASSGLEFTPSYANAITPIVSNNGIDPGSNIETFSLNETKYFAYWTDTNWDPPDNQDYYGWVSLTYNGSGLVVADSATALGGGIIVGTYTQIPEPSSALLLITGAGGILFYRRARQRQQEQHLSRRS